MSPLPNDERRALLETARRAIVELVQDERFFIPPASSNTPAKSSGVFITLRRRGRLRGCIGQMDPVEPLLQAVAYCAGAAAREDRRFEAVRLEEVAELEIEISVLSPLARVVSEEIEVGRHGLLVTRGRQRGLLLPQVAAEHRWTRERFLEETCVKGGMDRDAWKESGTRIEAFTAEVFSEAEFRAESRSKAGGMY